MKVLIASPSTDASRQLNATMGQIAPRATYLHAATADRVMDQLENHRIDVALLDLHLLATNPAATALLKLACPSGLVFSSLEAQLRSHINGPSPGVLITFDGSQMSHALETLPAALGVAEEPAPGPRDSETIWGKGTDGEWRSVPASRLQWAVTEGGKVKVFHVSGEELEIRGRLRELERQLESRDFLRVHKSYVVNLNQVCEVQRWSSGSLLLKMKGEQGLSIPVSRRFAGSLRRRTGWGIGPVQEAC